MNKMDNYAQRVAKESQFFQNQKTNFNQLPPMVNWLSESYLKPRVEMIFNTHGPTDFYAKPISQKAKAPNKTIRIVSTGSWLPS